MKQFIKKSILKTGANSAKRCSLIVYEAKTPKSLK